MSEERTKLLQRFEERLARLEAGVHDGVVHWKKFHLHKALVTPCRTINPSPACTSTNSIAKPWRRNTRRSKPTGYRRSRK